MVRISFVEWSRVVRHAALALTLVGCSTVRAQSCDLREAARHIDAVGTQIYSAESGLAALYFRADMDVNTDGAARSYHPDDPLGRDKALNNIANAITRIYDADGRDVTCSPRSGACFSRFIETFEAARDARYAPAGHPRVETEGIIPWRRDESLGWDVPCTITTGPNAGFFVSQTAVALDPTLDQCDQGRYLDSLAINANVLPRGADWRSQGVRTDRTDLVVARDLTTGRIAFGINGDTGPADKLGEGSVAFVAALGGVTLSGTETYAEIRRLARPAVEYLIFPTRDIRKITGGTFSQADIDRAGAAAFEEWGGTARLDGCGSPRRGEDQPGGRPGSR
jgi:hypothetical protein